MRMRDIEKMALEAKRNLKESIREWQFVRAVIDREISKAYAEWQELLDREKLHAPTDQP